MINLIAVCMQAKLIKQILNPLTFLTNSHKLRFNSSELNVRVSFSEYFSAGVCLCVFVSVSLQRENS